MAIWTTLIKHMRYKHTLLSFVLTAHFFSIRSLVAMFPPTQLIAKVAIHSDLHKIKKEKKKQYVFFVVFGNVCACIKLKQCREQPLHTSLLPSRPCISNAFILISLKLGNFVVYIRFMNDLMRKVLRYFAFSVKCVVHISCCTVLPFFSEDKRHCVGYWELNTQIDEQRVAENEKDNAWSKRCSELQWYVKRLETVWRKNKPWRLMFEIKICLLSLFHPHVLPFFV